MAKPEEERLGFEAINKLKSADPPLFLAPNSDLSCTSRKASQYLFSSLKQYAPKSPFDQLLTDGFDAEQIWQQIDLQSQPLITLLKREIKRFEKNPDQLLSLFRVDGNGVLEGEIKGNREVGFDGDSEEFEGFSDGEDEVEDEDEGRENGELENEEEDEEDSGESGEDEEDEEEDEELEDDGDGVPEVEDDFLKINELEKYLVREEEREYGSEKKKDKKNKKKRKGGANNDTDDDDDDDDSDDDDDDGGEDEIEEDDGDEEVKNVFIR